MKAMIRRTRFRLLLPALVATAAVLGAAPAAQALAKAETGASQHLLPPELQYGGIRYVTGGTGAGEASVFKEAMHKYSLAIELAERQKGSKHDAYTAKAMVTVSDHAGREIFSARANGPYMLLQLEPGRYSIAATLDKHTLHKRELTIDRGKTTRETFVFPAGTG